MRDYVHKCAFGIYVHCKDGLRISLRMLYH